MQVNRDQFMDQGFLVLRNVIPPAKLDAIRSSCEAILERQKIVWARDRQPDDPPGGVWETSLQPRVGMERPGMIDNETANVVEDFWVADETLDTASRLLCNPEPNVTSMWMMCNPQTDHIGGTGWHRDIHPEDMAPMEALAADFLENGPRYTQWNVPLYDDSVLWAVPGSHRRTNNPEENAQLLANPKEPVVGGVPVELRAGDGVIYSNFLIHTGSNYTTKLRRTLHGGHAIFRGDLDLSFTEHLSPWAQEIFAESTQRSTNKQALTETTLRAAMNRDADAYRAGLAALQPNAGSSGQTVLTIYLAKAALHIRMAKDPEFAATCIESSQRRAKAIHAITLNWGPAFAERFSVEESIALWDRFSGLDKLLQSDTEQFEPAFQSGPMPYLFSELPPGADCESFIASWVT